MPAVITAVAIIAAFVIGLVVGRQTVAPAPDEAPTADAPTAGDPAAPAGGNPLSVAEIAEAKDVPATLEDPSGNYELVAVVEGVEPNQRLTQNLQLVGAQRQQLLNLSQQFDALPADAVQQRELLAGEINSVRQMLGQNLQYMARTYGYSLQFTYQLVTHLASLHQVKVEEDGESGIKEVFEFKDAESYRRFQELREKYVLASVSEARRLAEENGASTDDPDSDEGAEPMEPSAEMKELKEQLIEDYGYDPTGNYQIVLEKTALYSRAMAP